MVKSWVEEKPIHFTEDDMAQDKTPDQTSHDIGIQATAETAVQSGAESTEQSPGFADRIRRQRRWGIASDPFGIAGDTATGVRLFEYRKDRQMGIKFEEKPAQAILDRLKEAGYRWNPKDMLWVRPFEAETARTSRIEAERLYQEVRDMIRQEKGIEAGQEVPF
jgi:hypothetical protein